MEIRTVGFREEHFSLYRTYQSVRHPGDSMDNPDPEKYQKFLIESGVDTFMIELRIGRRLLSVSVLDHVANGLSAVYTFYDPSETHRSPGIRSRSCARSNLLVQSTMRTCTSGTGSKTVPKCPTKPGLHRLRYLIQRPRPGRPPSLSKAFYMAQIPFVRDHDFEYGQIEVLAPGIRRLTARNPSAFTYHGTGTYIIGTGTVAVIDPGPADPAHLDALI